MACSNRIVLVSGMLQRIVTCPVDCYWKCPMDFSGRFQWSVTFVTSGVWSFPLSCRPQSMASSVRKSASTFGETKSTELCHSYPCPRPKPVCRKCSTNKWVQCEVCGTCLGRVWVITAQVWRKPQTKKLEIRSLSQTQLLKRRECLFLVYRIMS